MENVGNWSERDEGSGKEGRRNVGTRGGGGRGIKV
jgi:hypothetical protein